jgi:hypothetical protein
VLSSLGQIKGIGRQHRRDPGWMWRPTDEKDCQASSWALLEVRPAREERFGGIPSHEGKFVANWFYAWAQPLPCWLVGGREVNVQR